MNVATVARRERGLQGNGYGNGNGNVSVARWERGLQGFDDDPNWWIHPLLPHAHRAQC